MWHSMMRDGLFAVLLTACMMYADAMAGIDAGRRVDPPGSPIKSPIQSDIRQMTVQMMNRISSLFKVQGMGPNARQILTVSNPTPATTSVIVSQMPEEYNLVVDWG